MKKFKITPLFIPVLVLIAVLIATLLVFAIFDIFDWSSKIGLGQGLEVITLTILVIITAIYAYSTTEQAEATLKMAKQMAKPRLMPDFYLDGKFLEGRRVNFHANVANDGQGPAFDVDMTIEDDSSPSSTLFKGGYHVSVLRKGEEMGWPGPLPHQLDFPHSDRLLRRFLIIRYRDIDGEHEIRQPFVLTTAENNKPYARLERVTRKLMRKIDLEEELP